MWNEPFQNLIGLQFFEVLMCTSKNLSWYSSLFSSVFFFIFIGYCI